MASGFRITPATLALSVCLAGIAPTAFCQEPSASGPAPVIAAAVADAAELPDAPDAQASAKPAAGAAAQSAGNQSGNVNTGNINGTVTDVNGDLVPGATVTLDGPGIHQTAVADDNGGFAFKDLKTGVIYVVSITATGFDTWSSAPIALAPEQFFVVKDVKLKLPDAVTSVTVTADSVEMATEQVQIEEKQRVLGIIPNFYVVYDSKNAVPLTAKLKFKLALKVSVDPVSFAGALFLGAVNQAADSPNYHQGWLGYGQRAGAVYADGFTDLMFGGAILPAVLKQDPRYFYQGSGTTKSRLLHAMQAPFVCKGDNGKWQPNYSTIGGDLISASLSNLYYPRSNRGPGLVFGNLLVNTAERTVSTVIQEFVLRKLTPSAKDKN